ncbi:MAG TPA: Ku protein [Thermoanaerobaculia bacterium]|nr:Ku protein [Thermoanaerobaculia bacterium]
MAQAIWKGVIKIGSVRLPVKFYSAVHDESVHFRLLHKTDHAPVKQKLVSSATGDELSAGDIRKAYPVTPRQMVILEDEELDKLEPKSSRDIEIKKFVDPDTIDHRLYERAYFLGPDGDSGDYFAAAEALRKKGKEGVARWVMRNREYAGALRYEDGYLMLITLRYAEEVIDANALEAPSGRALNPREVQMAGQLIEALESEFDPTQYHDEYRARVLELIKTKQRGGKVKVKAFRPKKTDDQSLDRVLAASLARAKKAS